MSPGAESREVTGTGQGSIQAQLQWPSQILQVPTVCKTWGGGIPEFPAQKPRQPARGLRVSLRSKEWGEFRSGLSSASPAPGELGEGQGGAVRAAISSEAGPGLHLLPPHPGSRACRLRTGASCPSTLSLLCIPLGLASELEGIKRISREKCKDPRPRWCGDDERRAGQNCSLPLQKVPLNCGRAQEIDPGLGESSPPLPSLLLRFSPGSHPGSLLSGTQTVYARVSPGWPPITVTPSPWWVSGALEQPTATHASRPQCIQSHAAQSVVQNVFPLPLKS